MVFRPKILLVDDEPQMLDFLGEVLAQMAVEPHCLQSSQAAVELINRAKFDGVFLDWLMPEVDGLELARQIRWSKSNSLCPLVMITANPDPQGIRECFRCGINFFLQKPVSKDQIQRVVNATHDLMLQERLRYQRIPIKIGVHCRWKLGGELEQEIKGESINLSTSGMLLALSPVPATGEVVRLSFRLPNDPSTLELDAYVIRLSGQEIGIRFINLERSDRWRLINHSRAFLGFSPLEA